MIGKIEKIIFENENKNFFIASIRNVFGGFETIKILHTINKEDRTDFLYFKGDYGQKYKYGHTFSTKSFFPVSDLTIKKEVERFKTFPKKSEGKIITKLKHYDNNLFKSKYFFTGVIKEKYFNIVIDHNIDIKKITKSHDFYLTGYWFNVPNNKEEVFYCTKIEKIEKSKFKKNEIKNIKKINSFL